MNESNNKYYTIEHLRNIYPHMPEELLEWYMEVQEKFERLKERYKQFLWVRDKVDDSVSKEQMRQLLKQLHEEIDLLEKELFEK